LDKDILLDDYCKLAGLGDFVNQTDTQGNHFYNLLSKHGK